MDEVQYAPRLFRRIKVEIDRQRSKAGRFVLTGSQKFHLMKEISVSLAGRVAVLGLETLSVQEVSSTLSTRLLEAIVRGGYSELWAAPGLEPQEFFGSYLATYLGVRPWGETMIMSIAGFGTHVAGP